MNIDEVYKRVKALDEDPGWYQNIDLKCGLETKSRVVWGEKIDHPKCRWENVAPGFPMDFTGKSVLDVGCNAGFFSFEAADRGAKEIIGIDANEKYIEQARFCNEVRRDNIDFRVGNVLELTKLGRTFDITICIGLLYHVRDIIGAIRAISAVTKELVIVESAIFPKKNRLPLIMVSDGKVGCPGAWWPNMTALKYMFEKEGFKKTEKLFADGSRGGILAYK